MPTLPAIGSDLRAYATLFVIACIIGAAWAICCALGLIEKEHMR